MSWLVAVILAVTIVVEVFAPQIMVVFVPGFVGDPEKFELTVFLTRIMFPYLACMSLMAAYAAILNSMGRFFAAAFAPVVLNLVNIAALIPLAMLVLDAPETAFWVAVATMLGGIAQLALVYWAIRRAGLVPKLRLPRFDADVRRFWVLAVPAIIAGGITQINIFVGTVIASGADEVQFRSCPMPTDSINCRWALSALPSVRCCCPNCRAISAPAARSRRDSRRAMACSSRCSYQCLPPAR